MHVHAVAICLANTMICTNVVKVDNSECIFSILGI